MLNTFADAGHAPKAVMRIDRRATANLPKGVVSFAMKLPALKQIRKNVLADLGIPDEVVDYIALSCRFDARDTQRALRGTGIELPPLRELRGQALGLLGAPTSTRTSSRTTRSRARSTARRS